MKMPASASAILALLLAGSTRGDVISGAGVPCRIATQTIPLVELPEASGLAASRGTDVVLWSHNDSGKPAVLALDGNGSVRQRVEVTGAGVDDWEDIAVGPCPTRSCLYIADIGDNDRKRSRITVYRVPEPAPDAATTAPAQAFHAAYPDGPQDAEAFFVTGNAQMFVVTKGNSAPIGIYRFPKNVRPGAAVTLEPVGEKIGKQVSESDRVTGASASPDDEWVALRTHDSIRFFHTAELTAGRWQEVHRVDLRALHEPQGEGIAIARDGNVYVAGEGGKQLRTGTFARLVCALKP